MFLWQTQDLIHALKLHPDMNNSGSHDGSKVIRDFGFVVIMYIMYMMDMMYQVVYDVI